MNLARQYAIGSAQPANQREGVSLLAAVMLVTTLSALAASALMMSNASVHREVAERQQVAARYAADAALAEAVARLRIGGTSELPALAQPTEFGGSTFWIESKTDADGITSIVANGAMGNASFRQQLVLEIVPRSIYSYGAFGDEELEMASNAQVDSYNSDLGTYEELEVNGSGQSAWASDNGTIGSNFDILMRQNARTFGDALSGPGGSVEIMGNAYVTGSTGQAPEVQVLDPIEFPTGASAGALDIPDKGKVRLASGTHVFSDAKVGTQGVLEIQGPAQVVFDSLLVAQNATIEIDASGGMVEVFVHHDFVLSSNTEMRTTDLNAAGLALYLESDNIIDPGQNVDLDLIDLESNSKLYGTIYAPNANIVINSNFELYGAVVARRLRLDSNSQVHYDERLVDNRDEDVMTMNVIGWRVLPRQRQAEKAGSSPVEEQAQPSDPSLIEKAGALLTQ